MEDSIRCIAIIGAGFCGTVTAINLLREAHSQPLRIVLIDKEDHGRGHAYAAHAHSYLLNVPAGRMSAFASEPLDFLHFAQHSLPEASGEDFLPRALYGQYLQHTLTMAEGCAAPRAKLERVRGSVRSLELLGGEQRYLLSLQDGRTMTANEVVLALGNPRPATLRGADALRDSAQLIENPWQAREALRPQETVLVVGTGLTMADVVSATAHNPAGPARVYAISRHGLVPPAQSPNRNAPLKFDPLPLLHAAAFSMRQVFRQVRWLCREATQQGGDWRDAITFVRSLVPKLWTRLPLRERKRFLRHVQAYWDVHRHRLPPSTRATLDSLKDSGHLVVRAGHVLLLQPQADRVRVTWQPRGQDRPQTLLVDRVINCTGPDYRCRHSHDPLMQDLLRKGLIHPDPLAIGVRTAANGGVLNALGRVTAGLFYVGPMLRADLWESTAVHELREHAAHLARSLMLGTSADSAVANYR